MKKPDIGAPPWRASLWSAIAVVVLAAAVNLISSSRLAAFRDRTQHSEHIVAGLSALRAHLVDAETGQRGYLLTGEARYLDPYNGARSRVRADLASLDSLLSGSDDTRATLRMLTSLSSEKLAELDSTIALRQQVSAGAAMRIVLSDRGKALMDSARNVVRSLAAREDSVMTSGRDAEGRWTNYVLIGLLVGALISLGALTHLLRTLWRYEQSQRAAQREMDLQMAELERMARERMTPPSAIT